jgi:hypothetical protein
MDGQSEVVNKIIVMYLRCVTGDRPRAWVDWLAWAEYCYNTSFHSALRPRRLRLCTTAHLNLFCPIALGRLARRQPRHFSVTMMTFSPKHAGA